MLPSNIPWKALLDSLRSFIEAKKTPFPNGCSSVFFVESIEGWSKKQDKTSKQTVRSSDKSEWTIEAKAYMSHRRDVIRLRNPTEDKRAFRRMLTSADFCTLIIFFTHQHLSITVEDWQALVARCVNDYFPDQYYWLQQLDQSLLNFSLTVRRFWLSRYCEGEGSSHIFVFLGIILT